MRCLYPPPPHTGIAPTNQPRPNQMLSLADLPSTLSDLCAAASKAAEVHKEPDLLPGRARDLRLLSWGKPCVVCQTPLRYSIAAC